MSPPSRESSAPSINPFELGETIGAVRAALERIEKRLDNLPCTAHLERMSRLSADMAALKSGPTWLERNSKWLIPAALIALSVPSVRQCMGEQRASQVEAAVQRLEQRPATKVLVLPTPTPLPFPSPKDVTP